MNIQYRKVPVIEHMLQMNMLINDATADSQSFDPRKLPWGIYTSGFWTFLAGFNLKKH